MENKKYKTLEIKNIGTFISKSGSCYGEYGLWQTNPEYQGLQMLGCPRCGNWSWLKDHKVTIKNDLITIEPSIGCPICHAHYFVKQNKIEILGDC